MSKGACAQDQYIWILSENGQGCYLSLDKSENAWDYMQNNLNAGAQGTYETLERGNHYYQTEPSQFGIVVCAFTDETRAQKNYRMILTTLLQGDLAAMVLFAAAGMMMSRRVNLRIGGVTDTLSRIADGNTQLRLPVGSNDEIGVICDNFNQMMDQLELRTREEEQARRALDDARYHALQAQINPHFLYNTMETIGAIAMAQGCAVVDEMCSAISKMLRYSIQTDAREKAVTLREELAYVQDYMFIIGVRMLNEIQLRMDIEEEVCDTCLPRLSIQPLVENSIRHGLRNKRGEKWIQIRAARLGEDVNIYVEDNGVGFDADMMNQIISGAFVKTGNHTSIGIRNIQERIRLLFGEDYGISAKIVKGRTRMIICLPFQGEETAR